MVRWYHVIFSAYGFWLPNDPRGSWSTFIGSYELYKLGPATKTNEKRSLAGAIHDHRVRREGKQSLKYPPVRFDEQQRQCIGRGVEQACVEADVHLFALAIGHDHVHHIIERHARPVEQIVRHVKGRATQQMNAIGRHPMQRFKQRDGTVPSPWADKFWSVFISEAAHLRSAIAYVKRHPMKEGLRNQAWDFVLDAPV